MSMVDATFITEAHSLDRLRRIIAVLRNPHGFDGSAIRAARLAAADELEEVERQREANAPRGRKS